jgi:cytochrome c peroxidase
VKAKIALWCALAVLPSSGAAAEDAPTFTENEVRAILAHGPWPVPARADPSNRVSGKREAVELGERLFFDERLSSTGKFSCGTCHVPERNWTDNRARGAAAAEVERNTPTLMNIRLARWFGWDGASDSLWAQSIRPILDARELGASPHHVAELMRNDEQLACRYRKSLRRCALERRRAGAGRYRQGAGRVRGDAREPVDAFRPVPQCLGEG